MQYSFIVKSSMKFEISDIIKYPNDKVSIIYSTLSRYNY